MADKLGLDSQQFGYDALNRLTSAAGQYGNIDYGYDAVGDRTQRTVTKNGATTTEDYAYQTGSHRLQGVTTTDASGTRQRTFQHDANGNTISDVSPERALALAFNARNRLAEIDKDGSPVGMYQYNALGQRVAKTSSYVGRTHATLDQRNTATANNGKANGKGNANANSQSNLHVTTDNTLVTEHLQFVYDAKGNLIAENDDQGNVIREYIYLGNMRIAMTTASLDHPQVTPSQGPVGPLVLYFIHSDHLGTPRDVTDGNQNIVWAMHQTPFGEATLDTEAIRMPMHFPGQYADIESGLNYNYFREYDPTLGRYVESDPIGLNGGINMYAFASINPMIYRDIFGLKIEWNHYVFLNEAVIENIKLLNKLIVQSGAPNDSFVIRITGGDRYRDPNNPKIIRSLSNNSIVGNASQTSPHLIERGARAVDFVIENKNGPCPHMQVTNALVDKLIPETAFLPANTARDYPDAPHTHLALPPSKKYYYQYNPSFQ